MPMNVHSFTYVISMQNMYSTWVLHENKLNKTVDYFYDLLSNLVVKCCVNPSETGDYNKIIIKFYCTKYVVYLT